MHALIRTYEADGSAETTRVSLATWTYTPSTGLELIPQLDAIKTGVRPALHFQFVNILSVLPEMFTADCVSIVDNDAIHSKVLVFTPGEDTDAGATAAQST